MSSKSLKLIRAAWGCIPQTGGKMSMDQFLTAVKASNYYGIELPLVCALDYGKQELIEKLDHYDLKVVFQIFTDGPMSPGDPSWNGKFNAFHPEPQFTASQCALVCKKQIEESLDFGSHLFKINSHSMRDFFKFKQAHDFFNDVLPFQNEINKEHPNLAIMHETHRKRFFHSPWVVRDFVLENNAFYENDGLKMVSDYSHFTCVAESDTTDEHLCNVIERLRPKIWHIHGRVGYDHGPQVSDPRAPEWMEYTNGFEKWWDDIIETQMNNANIIPSFTPEHGPPNYQQTLPYTKQAIADIWDVNSFIGQRTVDRFNAKYPSLNTQKSN